MTRTTFLILLTSVATTLGGATAGAQSPAWTDARQLNVAERDWPTSLGADADGNLYLTSYSVDPEAADPNRSVFQVLTSWAPDGSLRWRRDIGSGTVTRRAAMQVDADGNTYIAISFTGSDPLTVDFNEIGQIELVAGARDNLVVMKYSPTGEHLWHFLAAGNDSLSVAGVAVSGDAVWVGGTFTGTATINTTVLPSAGGSDVFLARLSTDGRVRRAVRGGGASTDRCWGVAAAPDGEVVMLGEIRGSATLGGQSLSSEGPANFFLARHRADGSAVWARVDGGTGFSPATRFAGTPMMIASDRNGNCYVGISHLGRLRIGQQTYNAVDEADALVARYASDGTPAWSRPFGGSIVQIVEGLTTDADGNVYVGGFDQTLESTGVLRKLSPAGETLWTITSQRADGMSSVDGGPVAVDAAGSVYMAGFFAGTTRFGASTITSAETTPGSLRGSDIFVARLRATSGVGAAPERHPLATSRMTVRRTGSLLVVEASGAEPATEAALYTMPGRLVSLRSRDRAGSAGGPIVLDLGDAAPGAYLLVLRAADGVTSRPIMIGP